MNPYRLLFEPFQLGRLTLRNRIVMPPMGTNLANGEGEATQQLIDYYTVRAKGGAGLIVIEGTEVHPSGRGFPLQLAVSRDGHIEGLSRLAASIKEAGTAVLLQLHHGGRNTDPRVSGRQPLAPSALRGPVGRVTPEEMSLDQIELMVEAFGRAAERALEAGFDGVELHGAHEYLIHQFISPYTNKRTDAYGGDLDNRLRFALEIIQRIRKKLGGAILSFRLSGEDHVPDGLTVEDGIAAAKKLAPAGLDLISVTGGVYETPYMLIPPLPIEHGTHLALAQRIKEAVATPVVGVGRINSPALAELALKRGQADLIACGRAFLADPEWPLKAREGDWPAIRRCIGCNQGCIDSFFAVRPISCLYNPVSGHEAQLAIKPTANPQKIVVVGAGPAGCEAARVLDLMGHTVVLLEKSDRIGGQVNLVCLPPGKDEFKEVIRFYEEALARSRIEVRLGQEAEAETVLDEAPVAVVVATGAVPLEPDIPGIDNPSVVTAHEVLEGRVELGGKVVILGGGNLGLETANYILDMGRQVTVIEMGQQVGQDLGPGRRYLLMRRLREMKLKRLVRCKIRRIHPDRVSYVRQDKNGQRSHQELVGVETFVNAMGVRPLDQLALDLEGRHERILLVGDCLSPGKILDAVSEGARAAFQIEASLGSPP